MPTRPVYLVPHGKSDKNSGRLKRSGKRSAALAGETLRNLDFDATPTVVFADVPRFRKTAKIIGKSLSAKMLSLDQPYADSRGTSKTDTVDIKRTVSNWLGKTSHEGSRDGPIIFVVGREFVAAATKDEEDEPGKVKAGSVYSYHPVDGLNIIANSEEPVIQTIHREITPEVVASEIPSEAPIEPGKS